MKFWWKMSLAIVFSELTCINSDCSNSRTKGGGGCRVKLTSMFLDSLLLNSVTITLMSRTVWYPMPRTKQKIAIERKKNSKKKYKWLPFLFTKPQLGVCE